jgi:hypothetical protein
VRILVSRILGKWLDQSIVHRRGWFLLQFQLGELHFLDDKDEYYDAHFESAAPKLQDHLLRSPE